MDLSTALQSNSHERVSVLEFTDANEITLDQVSKYVIDGNISIEIKNGMRRTCNITLANVNNMFTPSSSGLVSISNRLKLHTGLIVDGVQHVQQRGVFVFGNPRMAKNEDGERTIVLEMYDKFALMDGTISGKLEKEYMVPAGTPIINAVITTAQEAGINTPIVVSPTSYTVPYDIIIQGGDTYADILYKLAELLTWEIFFDQYGVLRFQPPTDEYTQSASWTFSVSDNWYISSVHNFEWNRVRNNIVVVGDNVNGLIYTATSQNTNIFSDTYVGKIGLITEYITDGVIYTTQLAQDRADYELQLATQIQETVDMQAIPVDLINEGDIININDPDNDLNMDRCVVRTINFPLVYGSAMSVNGYLARQYQPVQKI